MANFSTVALHGFFIYSRGIEEKSKWWMSWGRFYVKTYCLVTLDNKFRHRKNLFGVGEINSLGITNAVLKFAI